MTDATREPCDDEAPDLNVNIRRRALPPDVLNLRLAGAADDAANEPVARPRIEAMLAACKIVLGQLETWHRQVADETDLALTGYSRASAVWLLSGRCLGLLRAFLIQVEAGVCTESIVTVRAIHEAVRVLFAFSVQGEDAVVRRWLDDEGKHGYVKQGAASAAQERFEEELARAMEAAGVPRIRSTMEMTKELYDHQSRHAHSRRSSCIDAVWEPARQMSYGVRSSPLWRAEYASLAGTITVEVVQGVGDAMRAFHARGWFTDQVLPLVRSIEAVAPPLEELSIRRAAGTA